MSLTNYRPANNKVLCFKETGDLRRSIEVWSTTDPKLFKVVRGLNANNQCIDTRHNVDIEELKRLWIDSEVNGYKCVANELFPRGILDCITPKVVMVDERAEIMVESSSTDQ